MKRSAAFFFTIILGMVAMVPATWAGDVYFGAKTGPMIIDNSAIKTDPTNIGFLVGYELGLLVGDLAVEGEFTKSSAKGKVKGGSEFDVDTMAAYLAFRTAGPVYLKAKGGFMQVDADSTESGASYGIGLGFGLGLLQIEAEYTQTAIDPDKVSFVSVGVQF